MTLVLVLPDLIFNNCLAPIHFLQQDVILKCTSLNSGFPLPLCYQCRCGPISANAALFSGNSGMDFRQTNTFLRKMSMLQSPLKLIYWLRSKFLKLNIIIIFFNLQCRYIFVFKLFILPFGKWYLWQQGGKGSIDAKFQTLGLTLLRKTLILFRIT